MDKYCSISIEDCIHTRRCFMTGEYCAKQAQIQAERKKLHDNDSISAFVVMNFSNMSDVVYRWRIKNFIESLRQYLFIGNLKGNSNEANKRLYCFSSCNCTKQHNLKRVKNIKVVRSDTNPGSNFVICNRVCQQMLIADLIVVDVSVENANVFYEFGMAVSLGKFVLPICYSESFFERSIPKGVIDYIHEKHDEETSMENHIDCFPWRKDLFEYYGIRYKGKTTRYLDYATATNRKYGFRDVIYNRFPYDEILQIENQEKMKIGQKIYEILESSYNNSSSDDNTVILYTLDNVLEANKAGTCIVNYYNNYVKAMKDERCFCGERVGVLIQTNEVPEDTKDAKAKRNLRYSVGEIIFIGVNQATYSTGNERIKPNDFMTNKGEEIEDSENTWSNEINRFTRSHIKNKGMLIYPSRPVYVRRVNSGLQEDLLLSEQYGNFYCLYHMMLRTLRFVNEIVVDISNNALESLFWLGAAHGSDINAITVRHEQTNEEKSLLTEQQPKERNIFDVAGLWTAIFHSHNTDGFYQQLSLVQRGIEQRARLMVRNNEDDVEFVQGYLSNVNSVNYLDLGKKIVERRAEEAKLLESYYRDRFWKSLLRYNKLKVYLPTDDGIHINIDNEKSVALWSAYLSRRMLIGQYGIEVANRNTKIVNIDKENYIEIDTDSENFPQSCLIMRRILPTEEDGNVYFSVTLFGKNIPSSLQISSLFIDITQQENISSILGAESYEPIVGTLIHIQEEVRNRFLDDYIDKLKDKLNKINESFIINAHGIMEKPEKDQKKEYIERVCSTMRLYLSAELYRYFIPFLSKEEEERIKNGAYYYTHSLNISRTSPFATDYPINSDEVFPTPADEKYIRASMHTVYSVLEECLERIKGVQVKYNEYLNSDKVSKQEILLIGSC